MSRMYVVQNWSNAAEYSGEQIGNRLADSKALHFTRDGKANTKLYEEPEIKAPVKKKSVTHSILLAERHMNRLEDMSQALEQEYMSQAIDTETYVYARKTLDVRLEKAWLRIEKERVKLGLNVLTEEECSSTLKTSKQNVVLHRVFDGLSEGNVFLGPIVAVSKMIVKLKLIYGVIKS